MLSFRILPRGIFNFHKNSSFKIYTSAQVLSSKDSSSSSSDSSDSDSDKEGTISKKQKNDRNKESSINSEPSNANDRLNALLQKIAQASTKSNQPVKSIDVAIKPKKIRFQKSKEVSQKEKPFEEQLISAAKDIANEIGGDTKKTELELLSLVLSSKEPIPGEKTLTAEDTSTDLGGLLANMKADRFPEINNERRKIGDTVKKSSKQVSVAESLLYAKSMKKPFRHIPEGVAELKKAHANLGILENLPKEQTEINPSLLTWEAMELREMKLATLCSPQNVFEELILWTEQGKLWHFPINNEQGMESESDVHFSEHVFMERHLKGWCPRKGPVRHFMELVCNGLSKNPYMTIEEKVGHITWYRNYFEEKSDLLSELGLLDDKTPQLATESKKQIEA